MITVCMTSHNAESYIVKQLQSILMQLGPEDELIVSDDGSTDSSVSLIKSLNDKRIRLIYYKQEHDYSSYKWSAYYYASANFNNALQYAHGDVIFFADNDDIWYENKVTTCLEYLKHYDIVCHNFDVIDEHDKLIVPHYLNGDKLNQLSFLGYLNKLPFRGCCLCFNRNVYDKCVPLPPGIFEHDCYIGIRSLIKGFHYYFVDTPLIGYRRHTANVSDLKSANSFLYKLSYRLKLVVSAIKN